MGAGVRLPAAAATTASALLFLVAAGSQLQAAGSTAFTTPTRHRRRAVLRPSTSAQHGRPGSGAHRRVHPSAAAAAAQFRFQETPSEQDGAGLTKAETGAVLKKEVAAMQAQAFSAGDLAVMNKAHEEASAAGCHRTFMYVMGY